jgi:hypothetical protein
MASLRDQLQARIDELDAQLIRVKRGYDEEVAKINARKAKLLEGARLLDSQAELAPLVEGLQKEGFLGGNS